MFVLRVMLVVWVICCGVVSFGSDAALASTKDYMKNGVTVTASPTWRPYSFLDSKGSPTGFLIDFWKKWSNVTGVPVSFKMVPWDESLSRVADGEFDIQSGLIFNKERYQIFDFSKPILVSKTVKLIRKESSCDAPTAGQVWGLVENSSGKVFLTENHPDVIQRPYPRIPDVLRALVDGEIDAAAIPLSTAVLVGSEMKISRDIKVCETLYGKELHAGVAKGNLALLTLVEKGIAQISEEELRFMKRKWFMEEEPEPSWHKILIPLSVGVVVLSFAWVFWMNFVRRRSS